MWPTICPVSWRPARRHSNTNVRWPPLRSPDTVVHIPEVLCHRSDGDARRVRTRIRPPRCRRRSARRDDGAGRGRSVPGTYRIVRSAPTDVPVSILIPFRDEPRLLRTCVDSIAATTGKHASVELVLIDNGSSDPETHTLVERLADSPDVRVLTDPRPFNWAALNNAGAREAAGDVLLFLNNDIEAHQSGWLSALLRPGAPAGRRRRRGPGSSIRTGGCSTAVSSWGSPGLRGTSSVACLRSDPGYLQMATADPRMLGRDRCLPGDAARRLRALGGFDETLGVDLNDVDYCLRAGTKGFRTLYEPAAELIHHESPSRGTAGGVGDVVKFVDRWKAYISEGDRYLNPHLTRADPSCGLARPGEEDDWNRWYTTLTMQ